MDIKEKFHANLSVIREQMAPAPVPNKPAMNRPAYNPVTDKSFVDKASSPQDVAQKAKQKAASRLSGGLNWQERSALGVDIQEADQMGEAKDEREYGYEGDMAITQLKTICRNAENLLKMMKPDTDLPEWVQSKITKSEDYISTAHDYLASEMNEETEQLDEISGPRLGDYLVKNTNQRKKIQTKFNAGKASRDEFRKGLRRVEGSKNAIKKLTGQAKVPAK